jgi:hypothetical protein
MMRNDLSGLLLLLIVYPVPVAAQPHSSPPRVLSAGPVSFMPTIPSVVASGIVSRAEWSFDGRYVLAARDDIGLPTSLEGRPSFTASLVLWDWESAAASELWRAKTDNDRRLEFEWLTGTAVAFALAELPPQPGAAGSPADGAEPTRWLYRVDARRKAVRPLGRVPRDSRLLIAPSQPIAVLFTVAESSLRIMQPDGSVRRVVRFPEAVQPLTAFWAADGTLIALGLSAPKQGAESRAEIAFTVDLTSGQLTPRSGERTEFQPREPALPLRLRQTSATLKEGGATEQIRPLWLVSVSVDAQPPVLVAPDVEWGRLSPKSDAVLYVAKGAAWVLPLLRLPKEQFDQARAAAMRSMLLSNARQIGLGLMMYAQDNDESLPAAGASIPDLLSPYIKGEIIALFDGFVYEHAGGPLAALAEPAKTRLGYIPGPAGRAVLYADGHATWEAVP